ncbi:MAG: YafY family protein [Chloroflexota bacterium]|nr:YafY family protein [Chloroflexota bacterium]
MNRTDRLLALVLELRLRGACRAEDLAQTFGTSKRTIYRDMQALAEAGVPIVTNMGRGYSLAEGYFLPPLAFTADEAVLILLGLGAINNSFDAEYSTALDHARRKIRGVLNDDVRERIAMLESSLHLTTLQRLPRHELDSLRLLRRAILRGQTVQFRYFTRHPDDGRVSLRKADPYSLVSLNGIWYLNAYCHLRSDRRMFRLTRMEALTLTAQTFERPADYNWLDEIDRDNRTQIARLIISEDVQPWIAEDPSYYIDDREPHPDGTLVTLRYRHIDEILQWILKWGRHVRVLEPPELITRIHDEAQSLARQHATPE